MRLASPPHGCIHDDAQQAARCAGCARRLARRAGTRGTRILLYHGTPPRDAGWLERQLAWLRRFKIVPLVEILRERAADGCVALTFDDGLRNNVQVAYPILRRLGLHATFFVCPGLIDRGGWLWNHEARQRLRHARAASPPECTRRSGLRNVAAPRRSARASGSQAPCRPRRIRPVPCAARRIRPRDWEELRALDPRVVSIGSHTLTHPILPLSSPQEIETEVSQSRARLEASLQRPVETFAYPNGAYDEVVHQCAQALPHGGGRRRGSGSAQCDPYLLPRLAAPRAPCAWPIGLLLVRSRLRSSWRKTPAFEQHGIDTESSRAIHDRLPVVHKKALSRRHAGGFDRGVEHLERRALLRRAHPGRQHDAFRVKSAPARAPSPAEATRSRCFGADHQPRAARVQPLEDRPHALHRHHVAIRERDQRLDRERTLQIRRNSSQ